MSHTRICELGSCPAAVRPTAPESLSPMTIVIALGVTPTSDAVSLVPCGTAPSPPDVVAPAPPGPATTDVPPVPGAAVGALPPAIAPAEGSPVPAVVEGEPSALVGVTAGTDATESCCGSVAERRNVKPPTRTPTTRAMATG